MQNFRRKVALESNNFLKHTGLLEWIKCYCLQIYGNLTKKHGYNHHDPYPYSQSGIIERGEGLKKIIIEFSKY